MRAKYLPIIAVILCLSLAPLLPSSKPGVVVLRQGSGSDPYPLATSGRCVKTVYLKPCMMLVQNESIVTVQLVGKTIFQPPTGNTTSIKVVASSIQKPPSPMAVYSDTNNGPVYTFIYPKNVTTKYGTVVFTIYPALQLPLRIADNISYLVYANATEVPEGYGRGHLLSYSGLFTIDANAIVYDIHQTSMLVAFADTPGISLNYTAITSDPCSKIIGTKQDPRTGEVLPLSSGQEFSNATKVGMSPHEVTVDNVPVVGTMTISLGDYPTQAINTSIQAWIADVPINNGTGGYYVIPAGHLLSMSLLFTYTEADSLEHIDDLDLFSQQFKEMDVWPRANATDPSNFTEIEDDWFNWTIWTYFGSPEHPAHFNLTCINHFNLTNFDFLDFSGTPANKFALNWPEQARCLRVLVNACDAFGGWDLDYATVQITFPNGTMVLENMTETIIDVKGGDNWPFKYFAYDFTWTPNYPEGRYNVTVTVYDASGYTVSYTKSFELVRLPEHSVTIITLDSEGNEIGGNVTLYWHGAPLYSVLSGNTVTIVNGTYDAEAYYLGVKVASETVCITSDGSLQITCNVSLVRVRTFIGETGDPVGGVDVRWNLSGLSCTTGDGGTAQLEVPWGSYSLNASYAGMLVASGEARVTGPSTIDVLCDMRRLDIKVLTGSGHPIEGAHVSLFSEVGTFSFESSTGSDGLCHVGWLPAGYGYAGYASYRGVQTPIYVHLDRSTTYEVRLPFYFLKVRVGWENGSAIEGAEVRIIDYLTSRIVAELSTNASGECIALLKSGQYVVSVHYSGIMIENSTYLQSDETVSITLKPPSAAPVTGQPTKPSEEETTTQETKPSEGAEARFPIYWLLVAAAVGAGLAFFLFMKKRRKSGPKGAATAEATAEANTCPKCKAKLPAGLTFCPYCGQKLS